MRVKNVQNKILNMIALNMLIKKRKTDIICVINIVLNKDRVLQYINIEANGNKHGKIKWQ